VAKKRTRPTVADKRIAQLELQLSSTETRLEHVQRRLSEVDKENCSLKERNQSLSLRNSQLEDRVVRLSLLAAHTSMGSIIQCTGELAMGEMHRMRTELADLLN
jgi:predicted nuclease with TOPRIM domain